MLVLFIKTLFIIAMVDDIHSHLKNITNLKNSSIGTHITFLQWNAYILIFLKTEGQGETTDI